MKIYDISRELNVFTAVWPGDEPFSLTWENNIDERAICNISKIKMSNHVGTHIDVPYHMDNEGDTVEKIPLATFMGPVFVEEVNDSVITPEIVKKIPLDKYERIIFKTNSNPPGNFNTNYTYISPEAAEYLAQHDMILVGVDAPSVDSFDSNDLPVHKILCKNNIVIIENLLLEEISSGEYTLVAFPLKIPGAEASPVRAALIK